MPEQQRTAPIAIEDKLHAWRDSENAADEIEARIRVSGSGAADPRTDELRARARELRGHADSMLRDIVDSLRAATDAVLTRRS